MKHGSFLDDASVEDLGEHAGDDDGSAIEIWPATTRGSAGANELVQRELPLPEDWPHHAYVTSDACPPEQVLAIFAREGWAAQRVQNGPPNAGFSLVRGWLANAGIEIGGSAMRAEYERFFREAVARSAPPAA